MKNLFYLMFITLITISSEALMAQTIIFSQDWEDGIGSWYADNGVWEAGEPTVGPESTHSGINCAGTILNGNYPAGSDTRLISPSISLPTTSDGEKVQLKFWQWFNTQDGYDKGVVQISVASGPWETISQVDFDGSNPVWTQYIADLTSYAGSKIRIGFYFTSNNDGTVYSGWYIDDVSIETEVIDYPNPEDFESGIGNWSADNGLWEVGAPTSGPSGTHSGNNCIGTVLDGNYPAYANTRLISPAISLPTPSNGKKVQLKFWQWFNTQDGYDKGVVQISVASGPWETISQVDFDGSNPVWTQYIADLTSYAGLKIRIGFYFTSNNDGTVYAGWYIDDIKIETDVVIFPNPEGFESGIGNWSADNGLWEVGAPTSGPSGTHSGNNCIGTVLNGNYPAFANTRLISPEITLTSAPGEQPMFFFYQWYVTQDNYDIGYIQISVNDGNWQTISNPITGNNQTWSQFGLDLSAYSDSTIRIAFYFNSNIDGTIYSGWYIDDIRIEGITSNSYPLINTFTADPTSGVAPLNVAFTATASDDDGTIAEYYWDFNGDGINDDTTSTGTNSYIYTETGNYNAAVRAKDDQEALSSQATIPINVYTATTRIVSLPDDSAAVDVTFEMPVQISDAAGVAGAEIRVSFDPAILEAVSVSSTDLTAGFSIADTLSDGLVAISMARATGLISGSGDLLNIIFHVLESAQAGQTTEVVLEHVALYDADTNPIEASSENGVFTVKQSGSTTGSFTRIVIQPALDTLSLNQTQLFSAYAIDTEQNQTDVEVNWSFTPEYSSPGEISSLSGQSTLFTATGYGDGYIAASYAFETDTLVDTAYVIVGDMKGDINIDQVVNVPDAILCLQIATSLIYSSLYQAWAADFNNNTDINSGDALGILNEALGSLFLKITFVNDSYKDDIGPALLYTTETNSESSDLLRVSVNVENRSDICGLDLAVDYNNVDYSFVDVSAANLTSLLAKNLSLSKMSIINPKGLQNDYGQLLNLYFRPKNQNAADLQLSFSSLNVFDNSGNDIESQVEINGADNNFISQKHVLFQNYPNPFNPSTTIRYDLAEKGSVVIQIYNVNGQFIRTLVAQNKNAGSHSVIWHGDDNEGHSVASGIYFYKVDYDNSWMDIKKMLYVK